MQPNVAPSFNEITPNAAPASGCRILMSIPTGFQMRQFVHSSILDKLIAHGAQVLIVSPNQRGEGFVAHLPQKGAEIHTLRLETGPLRRRYFRARQHLLLDEAPTATLQSKKNDLFRRYRWLARATLLANRVLRLSPGLRRKVLEWERFVLQSKKVDYLFSKEPINLVLLGSPGYVEQDAFLLHAAVRKKIPVVAAILSWDNLSSKGMINPLPDRLLVWSDHMRREAVALQKIPEDRIIETGTAVHDRFANAARFGSRTENLRRLGLDPARRLIFYGSGHSGVIPDEIDLVKQVARWVEEDALGVPCQLWVRLHPMAIAGPYSLDLAPYRALASQRVRVEFPPVRDSNLLWDLPKNDLEHLVGLLRDADVVVNIGSTLAIDAAILDRPVVCIAYDPSGDLPYEKSLRRYYDYTHMSSVIRAGAMQLASSSDDLRQKIVNYLNHPSLDKEGRRRIVEQQFGRVDGCSAARIVDVILNMTQLKSNRRCLEPNYDEKSIKLA